jgi:RimJ/RimL family protein N-acetyltransferase
VKRIILNEPHRVCRWVSEQMGGQSWSAAVGIGLEEDGRIIAGVVYDYWNGASICMHVASEPGSRWMTREYLWICFAYPFNQLGVRRVTGLVPESNMAARKFDEALGFELETRLKDAHPDGDVLVYKMTRDKCRFLGERYQKRREHEQA